MLITVSLELWRLCQMRVALGATLICASPFHFVCPLRHAATTAAAMTRNSRGVARNDIVILSISPSSFLNACALTFFIAYSPVLVNYQ